MKRSLILALLIFCQGVNFAKAQVINQNDDAAMLQKILAQTGDYCETLKKMALNYVCREKISETIHEFERRTGRKSTAVDNDVNAFVEDLKIKKTMRNSFLYDYQMVKKGSDFKEKRDLLEENGTKRDEKDVALKTMRITFQYLVFGPVGFLSRYWQTRFHYALSGREELDGKKTIIISVTPDEVREENYYSGRIWVDEADSSILKIEWEPKSLAGFEDKAASSIGTLKRKISMATIFGTIKNGIRFPSSQIIEESYLTANDKEHLKYKAEYRYENYRYFTVETAVEVK